MLRDYIIFRAACCPERTVHLHVRLLPQEDYDKLVPFKSCDRAAEILAQPKGITFEMAQDMMNKIGLSLRDRMIGL
jgi:hypothetical protein